MIEIEAVLAEGVDSLQAVANQLKGLWDVLAYNCFEASSIEWYREATILRFVTVNKSEGYYLTGKVRVSGGPYPKLAESFQQHFGELGDEPKGGVGS